MKTEHQLNQRISSNYFELNLKKIDWNFNDLGNDGLHGFHWYPATFVSAIPGSLIPILTHKDEVILDPFTGGSTTGIEAIRLGRRFIGVDINPIATLISRSKLTFPSPKQFAEALELDNLNRVFDDKLSERLEHPHRSELLMWYHPATYSELLSILVRIQRLTNPIFRIPAQAIFSSILKTMSSQPRHWGWISDNVTPKKDTIVYKNAFREYRRASYIYMSAAQAILDDMKHRGLNSRRETVRKRWAISNCDAVEFISQLQSKSIDLILTSPPYYGVADYIKSQRLSFLWFDEQFMSVEGFSTADFEMLRHREVGARSYRHRYSSFSDYMTYLDTFLRQARRVLKLNRCMVIVLGSSQARRDTMEEFKDIAKANGFTLVFEANRQIKETRRRLMASVKEEKVIVLQ